MGGNLIIMHGGGPTAVINSSLYGAIREAQQNSEVDRVLVAIGGTGGFLKGKIKDVTKMSDEELRPLLSSPASAIGTSRDMLKEKEYGKMAELLKVQGVKYVLLNGGNGTMDACGKLCEKCDADTFVMGIPKTMDNDIAVTDHSPGYGSAARYMAASTAELCCDVASLPIHIVVLEALGRDAGWVTASSALASDSYKEGPDLIYLPECAFDEEAFLSDVERLIKAKGYGVVVASEGLRDKDGTPIVSPVFTEGRATYFGDVSSHLSTLITSKLKYKARSEKPGLLCRASVKWQSETDRAEAELCGREAVRATTSGARGKMVGLKRISTEPYIAKPFLVDIEKVMLENKTMPKLFINAEGNGVTEEFKTWARPLLGSPLPLLTDLR